MSRTSAIFLSLIVTVCVGLFFLTTTPALAAPLVPDCIGAPDAANPGAQVCNPCHLIQLANNVIDWLIGVLTVVFAVLVMYTGFKLVTSGGNTSAKEDAKKTFTNAIIGFIIVLAAWLLVDTMMRGLLGDGGKIDGRMPWSSVSCEWNQTVATTDGDYPVNTEDFTGVFGVVPPGGAAGGGSCSVLTSGPCAPANLSCFGSKATQASQVCNIESGGGNKAAISGTDLCKDGRSFSGGLFQINILAHSDKLNNCSLDFFTKNGSGPQGRCLKNVTNSNGVSYCQIRDCRITNTAKYTSCMNQTLNAKSNIQLACKLFDARGGNFNDWITSARRCNVQ